MKKLKEYQVLIGCVLVTAAVIVAAVIVAGSVNESISALAQDITTSIQVYMG